MGRYQDACQTFEAIQLCLTQDAADPPFNEDPPPGWVTAALAAGSLTWVQGEEVTYRLLQLVQADGDTRIIGPTDWLICHKDHTLTARCDWVFRHTTTAVSINGANRECKDAGSSVV